MYTEKLVLEKKFTNRLNLGLTLRDKVEKTVYGIKTLPKVQRKNSSLKGQ